MSAFDGRITPIQVFKLKPVRLIVIETIQSEKYIYIHPRFISMHSNLEIL